MHSIVTRPVKSFAVLVQITFWILSFGFMVYLSAFNFGLKDAMLRAILVFICHLVNFYVCYSFIVPRYYEKKLYRQAFTGLLLLLLLLSPVRYYIEKQFITHSTESFTRFLNRRAMFGFVLFSEVSIIFIASLLRLIASGDQAKSKMAELQKLQLETELRFLKAQMSPHFLFNTINNIYSLVLIKSDKAPEALMKLSGLLRYLLYESHNRVQLLKEAEAITAFIELYQLKTEEKQNIIFNHTVKDDRFYIEPLLLLPLIENAIKHSGLGILTDARVSVTLLVKNGMLIVHVDNTKANPPIQSGAGGIGLTNIEKRLDLVYPNKHQLTIKEDEKLFSVTLTIME